MDVLDYNQLRKEFMQMKRDAKQYWKKPKKEEPQRATTEKEQKKQDFFVYLVTETSPMVG